MNYADLFNTIFAKDHLVQELGYFFVNEPSVAEFLGKVGVEEAQVQQNIWELRFSNFDESFCPEYILLRALMVSMSHRSALKVWYCGEERRDRD